MPEPAPVPEDSRTRPVPSDIPPVPEDSPTAPVPSDISSVPEDTRTAPVPSDSPTTATLDDPDLEDSAPARPRPLPEPPAPPLDAAGHARLRERVRGLRMLLGLIVLLGLSSLLAATRSAPRATGDTADLASHLALWLLAQLLLLALIALGLRALRRRRFGPAPSTRLRRASDVLLHLDAGLGGVVALIGFGPAILAQRATPLDWAIASTGLLLLALAARTALLHVTRP